MENDRIVYQGYLYVVAADPPAEEDPLLEAPAAGVPEDPEAAEEEESPEESIKKIDESPAAKWRDFLPVIEKDLRVRFDNAVIKLVGEDRVSDTDDPDLGFHITGYIKFPNGTPRKVTEVYGDQPIHFEVFVDGDGRLHYEQIKVYTEL